ncbi:hypothetical protein PAXINDRAFT_104058 [Paxillus involutus ATCC 200175]|uniref:C2H2-type domain-containing protein n=1 Tax=Paxillus involutus ATCC 200175 TaxID=664439 RepID=A0A0C9T901_PAXIN|nr:hypothetical protein PAXINDRAFT_104058 [Paxillus involutus ATCC 200175]
MFCVCKPSLHSSFSNSPSTTCPYCSGPGGQGGPFSQMHVPRYPPLSGRESSLPSKQTSTHPASPYQQNWLTPAVDPSDLVSRTRTPAGGPQHSISKLPYEYGHVSQQHDRSNGPWADTPLAAGALSTRRPASAQSPGVHPAFGDEYPIDIPVSFRQLLREAFIRGLPLVVLFDALTEYGMSLITSNDTRPEDGVAIPWLYAPGQDDQDHPSLSRPTTTANPERFHPLPEHVMVHLIPSPSSTRSSAPNRYQAFSSPPRTRNGPSYNFRVVHSSVSIQSTSTGSIQSQPPQLSAPIHIRRLQSGDPRGNAPSQQPPSQSIKNSGATANKVCARFSEGIWVDEWDLKNSKCQESGALHVYPCHWGETSEPQCEIRVGSTPSSVLKHLQRWHDMPPGGVGQITCLWAFCREEMNKESISRHVASHIGQKIQCPACEKVYTREETLRDHKGTQAACGSAQGIVFFGPHVRTLSSLQVASAEGAQMRTRGQE